MRAAIAVCVTLESERSSYNELRSNLDTFELTKIQTILSPLAEGSHTKAPFGGIFINGAVEAILRRFLCNWKNGRQLRALTRLAGDPSGRAGDAVRYEKIDGKTPVLEAF